METALKIPTDQEMRDRMAAHERSVVEHTGQRDHWKGEVAYWQGKVSELSLDPVPQPVQRQQTIAERTLGNLEETLQSVTLQRDEWRDALVAVKVIPDPKASA